MIERGDAFWMCPSGDAVEHIFVVVSEPQCDPDNVVLLPITTADWGTDDSCILCVGDHDRITHDSCIDYRRGRILSVAELDTALSCHKIRRCAPFSPAMMNRIMEGAEETRFLPACCDKILHDQGLLP